MIKRNIIRSEYWEGEGNYATFLKKYKKIRLKIYKGGWFVKINRWGSYTYKL